MTKRLLYILLAVSLMMVGVLAGLALPAAAEKRTVWVELPNGRVVPLTIDIPPGTPLSKVKLPGKLVTPPTSTSPTDTQPGEPTPTTPNGEPSPTSPNGRPQAPSHGRRPSRHQKPKAQPEVKHQKKHERRAKGGALRRADGTPTPQNPGFFDALPGPSVATGVPNFVIRKFHVPPFLLPIYQAAGIQYGVRWEVLAAINEIETDYGRNLNVSSAGAVGWMQFLPSTWRRYGVDANKDGKRDPYNPVDAIFAAARYLKAAGYESGPSRAIFAYNHAGWYVDSVLLRARLIAGVPADLIGSLTGLTEGRFPVYARARYADDLAERDQLKRVKRGQNAAQVVQSDDTRRGIDIFARTGSPVVAVNDGIVKKVAFSPRLGRYLVLQDVYGNRYTYAQLGSVQRFYPVPKADAQDQKHAAKAVKANDAESLPKPNGPASAGRQPSKTEQRSAPAARKDSPRGSVPLKQRLFAHPDLPAAREAGGLDQLLDAKTRKAGDFQTFKNYFSRPFGVASKDVRLRRLKRGSQVIGGTILGRVGKTEVTKAPYLHFEIRPAGQGAPRIDPKPILDGWKLLEATAIYRASGRNALYGGGDEGGLSIGQIILLPKPALERRVLSDPRIDLYPGGRSDIRSGQIDRRVLATLEYLAESGLKPSVTSLKSGHGYYTSSGNVSEHSSGNAVDISRINGIPILGHQERGGIAEQTVRMLMRLQGTLQPHQIISLLDLGGPTLAMADHADHIHVGFRPLFGSNRKLGQQILAVLRPGQWSDLLERLRKIDNPVVPTRPSKYALPARGRASDAHSGE
jgi:hypothetical protein